MEFDFNKPSERLLMQHGAGPQVIWNRQLAAIISSSPLKLERTEAVDSLNFNQIQCNQIQFQFANSTVTMLKSFTAAYEIEASSLLMGAWGLLLCHYIGESSVTFGIQPDPKIDVSTLRTVLAQIESSRAVLSELKQLQACWDTIEPSCKESIELSDDYPLSIAIDNRTYQIEITYHCAHFNEDSITRLGEQLQNLLTEIASDPLRSLNHISFLTSAEKQLLSQWQGAKTDYPRYSSIHQQFEAQVAQTPDSIALVLPEPASRSAQTVTYQELNQRANQLALLLKAHQIQRGTIVALYFERSIEMIVAMLGILKAGGVYLPLDLAYPEARIAWMLEDAQAPIILTQSALKARLPETRSRIICLEADWGANNPSSSIDCQVSSLDLAYINYTSGSTGQPKGVAISHRAVLRLIYSRNYAELDTSTNLLQLAPISFDAVTFEIWGALLKGGRCILYPGNGIPDPQTLATLIQTQSITTLWLTAALFNTLITEAPETLRGVSQLLVGGEALSVSHIRKAQQELPGTQLINGYGPTENTTFTCCYPIPNPLPDNWTSIPIGFPIENTEIYVLNDLLQPIAIGGIGELYVGGDGLAQGYINRPDLTAAKFILNPFSSDPTARLYRTGDLVRFLPEGSLEFIQRRDHQVKLRGFRIELGEIETVLKQHSAISDAVAVLDKSLSDTPRLIAYLTALDNQPNLTELRDWLKQRLAEYMLPSVFLVLDRMPLTPNGKLDRAALPQPANIQTSTSILPSTETEKTLADLWCGVLGLAQVGIDDNFFDLGGTSLLGLQLGTRIQKKFGSAFKAVKLYEHSTIQALANYLDQTDRSPNYSSIQARMQRRKAAQRNLLPRTIGKE